MSPKQQIYVFADLDDTLFQTERKCPQDIPLIPAATDRRGQILSFFTPAQQSLMTLLSRGELVPVTGRNTAALERVALDFASYRITGHGALVSGPDGQPDREWLQDLRGHTEPWTVLMEEVQTRLSAVIDRETLDARCRIIEDLGLAVYVSVKGAGAALDRLAAEAQEIWDKENAVIHRNGQNMALLPPFACKARAVVFVMERIRRSVQHPLFIGIGDSLSDLPFLKLCDYAIIPRHSQIREQTWA